MTGDAHIGREHEHALTAMHSRARQVLAARRFARPQDSAVSAAAAPVVPTAAAAAPAQRRPVAADRPAPTRRGPAPSVAPAPDVDEDVDVDEDLGFLDGRWTSQDW